MRLTLVLVLAAALAGGTGPAATAQTVEPQLPAQLLPAQARLSESAPELHRLFDSMGLYDIFAVMAAEGVAAGPDIEADMFPGQGGSAWSAVVAGIYSTDRMTSAFEAALPADRLTPAMIAELQSFYDSELGARIATGELDARQSFLEPDVEDAAGELARTRAAEGHPRVGLLTEFIAVNDLVDHNVSGALNSNFAFYRGLSDGGAFAAEIPEQLMLTEVWGQEAEIRTDLTEWLFAYQTLAYEGLSDAEMRAYIDLTATEAGQVLNTVLFRAFADLFDAISYDLGVAAAHFISGQET
ncbi:hypothetical protein [Roseicyclus mahoneyensis]|uniref:DUF2059 domain-containing protein n=1 Tax=Roseicyclus mahoneyensis TaxID=164332 RepID=A0A316GQ39_9RHOB|nr:hypothetical protein [Roseicyclus mahoneyensis]PWK62521.1 hypothetical protein C7455_101549 [Roseicyclus mahoneyensis]